MRLSKGLDGLWWLGAGRHQLGTEQLHGHHDEANPMQQAAVQGPQSGHMQEHNAAKGEEMSGVFHKTVTAVKANA
jgi:hypothetical protein